jgi:hypothetical protein
MPDHPAAVAPVVVSDRLAGVLVGDKGRLRFVAVDRRFRMLDGSWFARPEAAHRAAVRLARATAERRLGRPEGCTPIAARCGRPGASAEANVQAGGFRY